MDPPPEILKAAADPDRPIGAEVAIAAGMTEIPPLDARAGRSKIRWWMPPLAIGVLGACALAFGVRSPLLKRPFLPSERRYREGAEFG